MRLDSRSILASISTIYQLSSNLTRETQNNTPLNQILERLGLKEGIFFINIKRKKKSNELSFRTQRKL